MNTITLLLVHWILILPPDNTEVMRGKVVDVPDGNTIQLLTDENEIYKIELAGVDSPEMEQPFGAEAKSLLEKSLMGKKVEASIEGKNRWGIRQAIVIADGEDDPRIKLLKAGLAWPDEKKSIAEFEAIKIGAQTQSIGLWKDKDPTPPWTFRRQQTMLEPKYR